MGLIQAYCFGIGSGWNISVLDFWYLILNWVCVDERKFSSLLLNREKRRYCVVGDLIFWWSCWKKCCWWMAILLFEG